MDNILVPIDFSEKTPALVEAAAKMAGAFGGTIRLLHVAAPDPSFAHATAWPKEVRDELAKELKTEHQEIETLAESLRQRGFQAKSLLVRGDIAECILNVAERTKTDLIIMSSHRKGAIAELLPGSAVKGVLRKTSCPVLVVPGHPAEEKKPPEQ